jgi:hypothetical protein
MYYSSRERAKAYAPPVPILIAIAKPAVSRDLVQLADIRTWDCWFANCVERTGATRIPTIWRLFSLVWRRSGGLEVDDPPMLFCDTASLNLSRSSRVSRITAHSYHGRPPAWTPVQIARPSSKECGREKKLASRAWRFRKKIEAFI